MPVDKDDHFIMLSYCHKDDPVVNLIDIQLQSNYNVWRDTRDMGGGNINASMEKAVQDASLVILCVSANYRQSANCILEAQYTYKRKKKKMIIMLDDIVDEINSGLDILICNDLYIKYSNSQFNEKLLQMVDSFEVESAKIRMPSPTETKPIPIPSILNRSISISSDLRRNSKIIISPDSDSSIFTSEVEPKLDAVLEITPRTGITFLSNRTSNDVDLLDEIIKSKIRRSSPDE
jgi:hypothetical protein